MSDEVTIGVDIGTTSVKALAVDADGTVLARARIPHEIRIPAPDEFEHDARAAWVDGPRAAVEALGTSGARGICISAMVPSYAAVDADGIPITPGVLYGDRRGRTLEASATAMSGEAVAFLGWVSREAPDAGGYWMAQAVAAKALGGPPVVDFGCGASSYPVYDGTGWNAEECAKLGIRPDQMPIVAPTGTDGGRIGDMAIAPGSVDALGEQLVAGLDETGDVLVILGTTLITWAVIDSYVERPGVWCIPHHVPGKFLIGGPSNAGGLFMNWNRALLGDVDAAVDPQRVPVWSPYPRGERVPLHDPDRRAALHDLDLTMGPAAVRRAAYEAAGFVVRHHLDLAEAVPKRLVLTGGGTHDQKWVQALADCTGLPADVVQVPEGAALGAAWMGRMAAGLETSLEDARRWAKVGRRVEPDQVWHEAASGRYRWFRELAGGPGAKSH